MKSLLLKFIAMSISFSNCLSSQCLFFRIDSLGEPKVLYELFEFQGEIITIYGVDTDINGNGSLGLIPYYGDPCLEKFTDSILYFNAWSFGPASVYPHTRTQKLNWNSIAIPSFGDTTYPLSGPVPKTLIINMQNKSVTQLKNPSDPSLDMTPLYVEAGGELICYSYLTHSDSTSIFRFDRDLNFLNQYILPYNNKSTVPELDPLIASPEGYIITRKDNSSAYELFHISSTQKLASLDFLPAYGTIKGILNDENKLLIHGSFPSGGGKQKGYMAWLDPVHGTLLDSVTFHFGAIQSVEISTLIPIEDGWLIGGSYKKTARFDAVNEVFITRIKNDKSIVWNKIFNITNSAPRTYTFWTGMKSLSDKSYIAWGYTYIGGLRTWLMKFDADGNIITATNDLNTHKPIIELHPNPASDIFKINGIPSSEILQCRIMDSNGLVRHINLSENMNIQISDWNPGLYTINLTLKEGKSISMKLLKL